MNAAPGHSAGELSVRLHSPLPDSLEVGRAQHLVVSGDCLSRERVEGIAIVCNGERIEAELSRSGDGAGFWQAVPVTAESIGARLSLEALVRTGSGAVSRFDIGGVHCIDVRWEPVKVPETARGKDLVAICMATFEPGLDAFRRQIDSIRSQTHGNWICIINDDGTPDELWRRMQDHVADDDRFVGFRNPVNLGFYGNFERALARVPGEADCVAFSDQDDYWYPHKLETLVGRLRAEGAELVYGDVRIVDGDGVEIAPSYWVNRRNEYEDFEVVLVANTVTGAASLFRRELLERVLPFPPRVGDAFHDHWVACVAMNTGSLAYVDEPLHDYYQYGSSVIGHCDFERFTMTQRVASLFRLAARLCRPSVARPLLRGKYASAIAIYRGECRRLRLVERTIRARCRPAPRRARQLTLFDGGARSMFRLLALHLKVLVSGRTTDDAELRLAMGELARIVERRRLGGIHATD